MIFFDGRPKLDRNLSRSLGKILTMSGQRYRGFYIAVEGVKYAVGTPSQCPLIKITSESEADGTVIMLFSTDEFRLEKDAEAYGFQMGARWIDTHLRAALNLREGIRSAT